MERKITSLRLTLLLLFLLVISPVSHAQVYLHDFGTADITAHPYTVAPTTINADLSGSSWSNSTGSWTSFAGVGGNPNKAIALSNSAGTPTITLTFNVAAGKQLDITSFDFWRMRSNTGAQAWTLSINGIPVGLGLVPTTGSALGNTPVALPVTGLTGQVNVVLALTGASGTGTFRLDNFTLNGTVSTTCIPAVVTSFAPASGPSNTLVTINGLGFSTGTGTSAVNFNGQPSSGFTVVSDTQIKAIVPATATTGPVSIITNGCEAVSANFTVIETNCNIFTGANDLFISEVYDATTGEGGAIELYNGTPNPINLSIYSLARYADIGDALPTFTVSLSGTLAPGGVYIARTAAEVCSLTGTPSTTLTSGFNANDEIKLFKNSIVIDDVQFINEVGFSYIRNAGATVPSSAYTSADWAITSAENCANLGVHTINTPSTNHITAQPFSAAVCEGDSVTYNVTLDNVTGFVYQWKMLNSAGVWVNAVNSANISGATTASITINEAPLSYNNTQFYCEVVSVGCTLISNAVQLTVSPLPVAIVTIVQPTCVTPTGSILIIPSIGDGLTYSINGTTYQSGALFTGIAPGTYTLYVKSSANCISEFPFTINAVPTLPAVAAVTVTQPTCGVATGSITINSPLDLGLTYSVDGSLFQSGTTFTGLAPGTYTITVMTALGCTSITANITINAAPATPAVATVTTTQPTCTVATGTIVVTAPTGAGLMYSINGGTFQSSAIFSGLAAGNYTITTQNAAGCTSVTAAITINAAPVVPAVPTTTITQPTCTVATGSITVTAPTGAGYTYSINGGAYQTSATFTGLAAGSYTITTQATGGCTATTAALTINAAPAAPAVATTTVVQPTCTISTGTITVTAPTGAGLTYSINGGAFQSSAIFSGLAAGNYTITTQNAAGCTSVTAAITINAAPVVPAVPTTTITQPTCTVATGSITVTAPTGAGYTYSINGGAYQTSATFTGLAAGSYTITTQATGGCTASSAAITINAAPAAPAVATTTVVQPTCTISIGTITVTAPTGAGLMYSINGGAYQSSAIFSGLTPGSYTITTQNTAGCTSVTPAIAINAVPAAPAVATTTVVQPTCTTATGTITVSAPTGTDITYSINNGTTWQAGTTFTGLAAGNYTITTQNASGCTSVTANITINPAPVVPAGTIASVMQPTCTTASGSITVTAPTGAGLTYSLNGGTPQTGVTFAGLAPGTYTITTQNAAGCTSTSSTITIDAVPTPPVTPVVSVIQPNCTTTSKGAITVTSPTGTGFTYSIDGTTWQAGTTFNNLAGGTYTVTVQNSLGCTSSVVVTINAGGIPPDVATTTVTPLTCTVATGSIEVTAPVGTGLTYSIDGGTTWQATTTFSGLTPGAYQIMVMNAGGCTSLTPQVGINPSPVPALPTTVVTQPTCFDNQGSIEITAPSGSGITYSIDGTNFQFGGTFPNLDPGTYTITVQSLTGCTSTAIITINTAPVMPASATLNVTQPTCDTAGGTITVTSPVGTGYSYSIDGITWQTATAFTGLEAGSYDVTVQNADGCSVTTFNIDINQATGTIQVAAAEGCEATVEGNHYMLHVMPQNGSFDEGTATYTWVNENGLVVSNSSSFDATEYVRNNNINPEEYPLGFIALVSTPGGCTGTATFNIGGTFCDIPKGISPNDDNMNDNFDISGMNASKVSIFNRYGQEVYTRSNYTNEWYGQSNNNDELPSGTYYYVVVLPAETKTGWVYINREVN